MYACLCRNITDKDIKEAVCQGQARCNKELANCKGKPQCGSCCQYTNQLIKNALSGLPAGA